MTRLAGKEKAGLQEVIVPTSEGNLKTGRRYNLDPGYAYLIVEEQARQAFEIFRDLVTHGAAGLCITRLEPGKVSQEYGLEKTPILWLSRVATVKNAIRPAPVENVAMAIGHFLEMGKDSVVLVDGLEYLVAHNKFPSVLSLLSDLVDKAAICNAILLLPVNPTAWRPQELNQIKRDVRVITPGTGRTAGKITVTQAGAPGGH